MGIANILSATPGTGPGLDSTTQAIKNQTKVCSLLRDSIIASTTQCAMAKDTKGFKKLPTHTQQMILWASEPTAVGYIDAQGKLLRTEPQPRLSHRGTAQLDSLPWLQIQSHLPA
jgi:hypothetical protein